MAQQKVWTVRMVDGDGVPAGIAAFATQELAESFVEKMLAREKELSEPGEMPWLEYEVDEATVITTPEGVAAAIVDEMDSRYMDGD